MTYDMDENVLYIFTDGASRSVLNETLNRKTGRHWWKWIRFVHYDKDFNLVKEDKSNYVSYTQATNQDMELRASVDWLKLARGIDLSNFRKICMVTDSKFIYDNWKCAIYWHREKPGVGRKTRFWDPVIHKEKRKELSKYRKEIYQICNIKTDFDRVKGHKDNEYNKLADKSAVKWAQSKNRIPIKHTTVRSRFFKNSERSKEWYLKIHGQTILIHVSKYRYTRNKWILYNFEVVSPDSEYFMQTGWIWFNKKVLSSTDIYLVKIKDGKENHIEEIISTHTKEEIKNKYIELGIDTSILFGKLGKDNL